MIGLISCCGPKLDRAAPARELYTSPLFTKSLAFLQRNYRCRLIYVISAKHGLVGLDEVIEPYDATVAAMNRTQRVLWAGDVARRLFMLHATEIEIGEALCFLAGESYVAPIVAEYRTHYRRDVLVLEPLRGMPIGERLQFLNSEAR